jgi:hypothetical protein
VPKGRTAPFLLSPLEIHVSHDLPLEFVFSVLRLYRYRRIHARA